MDRLVPPLARNIQAGKLLEVFLISAVVSLLGVRLFLHLTGYPQLGNHHLHIAHMIWGGLLMLLGLLVVYIWLNAGALRLSSILGGAGFGIFIDELGKFITRDNNYFYQPTIALIYLIFISLFLVYRFVDRQQRFSTKEYLVNALRLTDEAVLDELDPQQEELLQFYLDRAGESLLAKQVRKIVGQLAVSKEEPSSVWARLRSRFISTLQAGVRNVWLDEILATYFGLQAVVAVGLAIFVAYDLVEVMAAGHVSLLDSHSLYNWGYVISLLLATSCAVWGCVLMFRQHREALLWFKRSLLVMIFVVQFFAFYREQLNAVFELAWYVFLYICVTTLLNAHVERS